MQKMLKYVNIIIKACTGKGNYNKDTDMSECDIVTDYSDLYCITKSKIVHTSND
jgi:hypothetical protein